MKKFIALLVLLAAFVINADPVGTYTDAVPEWDFNLADTVTTAFDTMSGNTDSVIIFSKFVPEAGWEYILARAAFDGGSCDSLSVFILVRSYGWNDEVLCSTVVDTVTLNDCTGDMYLIPFGTGKLFGKYFDILFTTFDPGADPGNRVIVNRCQLFRRRPIIWERKWR